MLVGIIIFIVGCLALLFVLELFEEQLYELLLNVLDFIVEKIEDVVIFILEKIESWGPQY